MQYIGVQCVLERSKIVELYMYRDIYDGILDTSTSEI